MSDNVIEEVGDFGEALGQALQDPATLIIAGVQVYTGDYVGAATTIGLSTASRALAPDLPSLGSYNADGLNSRGKNVQFRSPIASRQIIYGKTRTSGVILRIDSKDANNTLQIQIALSGRPIDSITAHYVNEEIVRTSHQDANAHSGNRLLNTDSSSTYYTHLKCQVHYGGNTAYPVQHANYNWPQSAVINSISYSTSNFMYDQIAYAYVEMYFDSTIYKTGVPGHSFEVKGCEIFDPRDSSTAWSANAALVIRDFLTNEIYGLGCTDAEIDDTSFIAAANICDETVGGEARYEINGIVDCSRAPKAILEDLLTACVGKLVYSGGKFKLLVGEYQTPTKTITKNMIVSDISIGTKNPARNQVNSVKGTFVDKDQDYLTTDFTPITDSVYYFEDDAEDNFIDLTLPFTTSKTMAERIAEITLRQIRNEKTISMSLNLEGFDIDVGDTVYYTDERLGFDQATFECISWELINDGTTPRIDIALRETNPNLFDTTVEIAPISRNAKDEATRNIWYNHADGYFQTRYVAYSQDLSTVFGSYWTQDIVKEYLIGEDVHIEGERESTDNPLWASTTSPQTYSTGGEVKRRLKPAITIPGNLKGKLIIRNRGRIYNDGGYGGYLVSGGVLFNQSPVGEDGGDVLHWLTTSADNQPSDGGTVLIVNDGTIGAGGGGGRAINNATQFAQGGSGSDGLNNNNVPGTGVASSGTLLSNSYFTNGNYYIGGFGGDAGDSGDSYYIDSDGLLPWTPSGPDQTNAGEIIRVASSPFDLTSTTYDTSAYVQDADGNSRIKINNRGTITGDLHSAMSSLTDVYLD